MFKMPLRSRMMSTLKGMGRKDQWRRYMTGKGYTDAKVIGKYKVQYDEDERDTRILVWNPNRPCVAMVIDKADNTAVIDSIEYDPDCTIDERMVLGEGTREMLEFSLDLLKSTGVKKVFLTDRSTIDCNGNDISLGRMYFLKHGMTWYERYFGFQPIEGVQDEYVLAKKNRIELLDVEYVSAQPCDFFDDKTMREIFRYIGLEGFSDIVWVKCF